MGHEALSKYIEARIEGSLHEQALVVIAEYFIRLMREGLNDTDTIMEVKLLVDQYMEHHKGWPEWRLLGTEERIDLPINGDITFPIRYDLLVEEVSSGKVLVGDFKFTYDFWTADEHALNPQLPKYIVAMNANGIKVDGGFLEEIRTRRLSPAKAADVANLWRRTKYFPSLAKKRNVMKQHILASQQIIQYHNASAEGREEFIIPVLNKHGACKFCNFKDLCRSRLDGGDTTELEKLQFTKNTYGYNDQITEEML